MIEEKKKYTLEDLDRLKAWFDEQELPKTFQISKSEFTPNLKETVHHLFEQAYDVYENPKMYGSIRILERIKKLIEEK